MSLGCYGEYQSPLSVLPSCVKKCGQQVKRHSWKQVLFPFPTAACACTEIAKGTANDFNHLLCRS